VNAISRISVAAVLGAWALATGTPANAATISISQTNGQVYNTNGISPTITNGNNMDGLKVSAVVSNGTSSMTLNGLWGDLADPDSGGVSFSTPDFSISVEGDTFESNIWALDTTNAGSWRLLSLDFDGSDAKTVFDRTFGGSFGTPGSVSGKDFAGFSTFSGSIGALYRNAVGVNGNAPIGDIFASILISFGDGSFANALTSGRQYHFSMDTDNTTSALAPEPGSMFLLGTGLLVIAIALRRFRLAH
jgi:PEP-CTERM motif